MFTVHCVTLANFTHWSAHRLMLFHFSCLIRVCVLAFAMFCSMISSINAFSQETIGGFPMLPMEELKRRYEVSVSPRETTFFTCKIEVCAVGSVISMHLQPKKMDATVNGVKIQVKNWSDAINSNIDGAIIDVKLGTPKIADFGSMDGFETLKIGLVEVELTVAKEFTSKISPFWTIGFVTTDSHSVTLASSSKSPSFAWSNALGLLLFAISRLE
jgi:hypothetical protein